MRWSGQTLDAADEGALPGLERSGLVRSVQTPEFEGITFHEVLCKSALNKITGDASLPFTWTINPARGCSHACRYCFARPTHEYLDLDAGTDFDSQIVVKTNIAAVLRKELARRSWKREPVALGTNTDPYQRAEGRYRLMPGIIRALAESGTPFSILTKGTLLRRDLPLLTLAAQQVDVRINVSLAIHDADLQKQIEPGTPSPKARLELIRAVRDAGLSCGVMVAPVIPFLTDGARQLDALFAALADAGATSVTAMPMHLRSSTKDWFLSWLAEQHPALVRRYRQLYGHGAYVTPEYKAWLRQRIDPLLDQHGFGTGESRSMPENVPADPGPGADVRTPALTLF
ncbi:Rv2578c family radical SAM protein [Rhodococcoides kyotonense]|uniref:DNA repair photolyase n=1 Tax=Rhodococcoides kyotonense TaxID=398843 RepID=A0A239CVF1_9NOCA|nr:Rv2578c family radical SAM protein [Rhodococcus kyotonensis]SNS23514.1 DNA repair photolyase [Rhodococcus kyotonensis]